MHSLAEQRQRPRSQQTHIPAPVNLKTILTNLKRQLKPCKSQQTRNLWHREHECKLATSVVSLKDARGQYNANIGGFTKGCQEGTKNTSYRHFINLILMCYCAPLKKFSVSEQISVHLPLQKISQFLHRLNFYKILLFCHVINMLKSVSSDCVYSVYLADRLSVASDFITLYGFLYPGPTA